MNLIQAWLARVCKRKERSMLPDSLKYALRTNGRARILKQNAEFLIKSSLPSLPSREKKGQH